nr:ribonuclease H-like domain-containing protein [Tanacetum cinerariifolium]
DKSSESETHDFASCVLSPLPVDSFSPVDVKILPKSDVQAPSPTNGVSSCSIQENVNPPSDFCNKPRIADNFPLVVLKAASVPAGSRNSSASTSAGRSIPAASRKRSASMLVDPFLLLAETDQHLFMNRPAAIHAGRHIPAGRSNNPAPFLAGQTVPTGWINHEARPFFGPTNLCFDNVVLGEITDLTCNEVHPHVNKDIGIIDGGCSRSMIGNKENLANFVQVKGGTVTFGGGDGKITGKGTIMTSKLDFENVYYVEELKNFNLFSVS